MNPKINCPKCGKPLKVIETEVESNGIISPTVYSCALCAGFLGISPNVEWLEPDYGEILGAIGKLNNEIAKLTAAISSKK